MKKFHIKKIYIGLTALLLAFFVIAQGRSLEAIDKLIGRENTSNIFQEIKILKDKNLALKNEINDLELNIEQLSDQNLALEAIHGDIKKYKMLSGKFSIFGPGVTVTLTNDVPAPWVIDLINEFFSLGAEAVDINGIRISNHVSGIDTLPQGQMLLNGSILTSPYVFNAIGDSNVISTGLELPGGIFNRLSDAFPGLKIDIVKKDVIHMK
jgi:uncharacterized protein YlxW (UPF0749 family)